MSRFSKIMDMFDEYDAAVDAMAQRTDAVQQNVQRIAHGVQQQGEWVADATRRLDEMSDALDAATAADL